MIGLLREYVGVCGGNLSVGRPRKRWIDTVKDCLRKRGLDVSRQGEWCWIEVNGGNAWGVTRGILWVEVRAYNLKDIKGKICFFSSLLLYLISWHDACSARSGGRS